MLLLERLSRHTEDRASHQIAEAALNAGLAMVGRVPHAGLGLLCAADFLHASPVDITLAPDPAGMPGAEALRAVHRAFLPNLTLRMGGTALPENRMAARICRQETCLPPIHCLEELEQELRAAAPRWTPGRNL